MDSWVVPGYTEVRDLGCGRSGRVTLAWHDPTGTPVAIRYLGDELRADEDSRRAFQVESHRLTELDDPHVVRCYEYVEAPAGTALVMELVDGATLREILDEGGPLGLPAALTVLKDSLLGLAAAHRRGVLHRDYRPENVLVDSEGRAKLIEFGLTRSGADTVAADLSAAAATFAECGGPVPDELRGIVAARLPDALALLTAVEDAAAGYAAAASRGADPRTAGGPDAGWEERGREVLADRAARLIHVRDSSGAETAAAGRASRWGGRLLISVAVVLVVVAAVASFVTR